MRIPCYISGPYRGPDHWVIAENTHRAKSIALAAWRTGFFDWVYCPHANTDGFQDACPDEVWLEGHLAVMRVIGDLGGVLIVVPNWGGSDGTRAELLEAHERGIPAFLAKEVDVPAHPEMVRRATLLSRLEPGSSWGVQADAESVMEFLDRRAQEKRSQR